MLDKYENSVSKVQELKYKIEEVLSQLEKMDSQIADEQYLEVQAKKTLEEREGVLRQKIGHNEFVRWKNEEENYL